MGAGFHSHLAISLHTIINILEHRKSNLLVRRRNNNFRQFKMGEVQEGRSKYYTPNEVKSSSGNKAEVCSKGGVAQQQRGLLDFFPRQSV